jgi:hypothetical protein
MNKLAAEVVGQTVADLAQLNVRAMTNAVAQAASEYDVGGPVPTQEQVQAIATNLTTQDSAVKSKRVWAFALPILSTLAYALLDPSLISAFIAWLQAHPGAWWGVAANIVAVTLPIISRALDKRPVR